MRSDRWLKFCALLVWFATLCLVPTVATVADQTDLAKRDWSVKAADSLVSHLPSKESVAALLGELIASDPSSFISDEIDSFRFVDLHRSGTLSLVVEQGASRCGGAEIDIIDKTPSGLQIYRTEEGRPQTDELIEDINKDGNFELVVDVTYVFHDCASYDAVFPVIYAWTGAGYGNVSNRFGEFYQRRLETLRSKLATIHAKKQATAARGLEGLPTCQDESDSGEARWSSGGADAREQSPPCDTAGSSADRRRD